MKSKSWWIQMDELNKNGLILTKYLAFIRNATTHEIIDMSALLQKKCSHSKFHSSNRCGSHISVMGVTTRFLLQWERLLQHLLL